MTYTIESISLVCVKLHDHLKKVVLATGFFDLLHSEHINFLQKARAAGDVLIVAVESDERARKLKGDNRPVEPQSVRCEKVLQYADYVVALPSDFDNFKSYDSLMSAIKPEIYAISSHTNHQKSKNFLSQKYGGHLVVVHNLNPDISTTQIIEQNQV